MMKKNIFSRKSIIAACSALALAVPVAGNAEQPDQSSIRKQSDQQKRSAEGSAQGMNHNSQLRDQGGNAAEPRYRMREDQTAGTLSNESLGDMNDVKAVLVSAIEAAVNADMEAVVDHLARSSRDRLDRQADSDAESNTMLEQAAENFRNSWDQNKEESFSDELTNETLDVTFLSGQPEESARVRVSDGQESVELTVINEGTIMDSWKIEAPADLDREELRSSIRSALIADPAGYSTQRVALNVLKKLGDSQSDMNSGQSGDQLQRQNEAKRDATM